MMRANYVVAGFDGHAVYLHDPCDGRRTITNDAERILAEMRETYPDRRVLYRDTCGDWCEIVRQPSGEPPRFSFLRLEDIPAAFQ